MLLQKELGVVENSYYEASTRRPAATAALTGAVKADVCVIGGGYAGVSAALELADRGMSVVLLEAQRIGWGASGRNGGQVIVGFGADGECAIEKQLPPEEARRAWDVSVEAVQLLRKRIARYAIECNWQDGFLSLAVKPRKTRELQRWAEHVCRTYGYATQWLSRPEVRSRVDSERFDSGVFDAQSGHLHPLKYCLGLADVAQRAGVRVFENSPALRIERGRNVQAKTAQGEVSCDFLVLAGNVYLAEYGGDIAPEVSRRIMPVGTYIVATEPMDRERADRLMRGRPAASDTNFVLDYFRLTDDHRLLFGAGDSYSAKTPRNLIEKIRANLLRVFPQLADLDISYAWGGFVDITMNKAPDFGRLGSNIYYLQGFSGHGIAMAGMAGKLAAEAIVGQAERFDLFSRIHHSGFPGGALMRTPALVLGTLYYRLRDLV